MLWEGTAEMPSKVCMEKERLFCPGEKWWGRRRVSETYPFRRSLRKTCEAGLYIGGKVLKIQASYEKNISVAILTAETLGKLPVLPKQFRFFEAFPCRGID